MNSTTKFLIVAVAVAFVGGAYYFFILSTPPLPLTEDGVLPASAVPVAPSSVPADGVAVVAYADDGFSPSNVSIAKGGTVKFVNQSSEDLWVGANPHPVHSGYPTEGGCVASTFDTCRGIPPGGFWEFTFDIAGTWGYHDHLNPGKGGRVTVR